MWGGVYVSKGFCGKACFLKNLSVDSIILKHSDCIKLMNCLVVKLTCI